MRTCFFMSLLVISYFSLLNITPPFVLFQLRFEMPPAVVDAESGPGVNVGSGLSDLLRIQAVDKCVDNVLQLLEALRLHSPDFLEYVTPEPIVTPGQVWGVGRPRPLRQERATDYDPELLRKVPVSIHLLIILLMTLLALVE